MQSCRHMVTLMIRPAVDTHGNGGKTNRRANSSERPTQVEVGSWEARVAYAAKRLHDPIALNASPLTRLRGVERYADSHYKKRICAKGFALRDLLRSSIDSVVEETADEKGLLRVHQFLTLFRQGVTVIEISRQLGLSREHVSRVYKKEALHLVTVKFLCLAGVRGNSGVA